MVYLQKPWIFLAIEEPLEIRLEYGALENPEVKSVSVTMRTPGNDAELATGFLFTEGIINTPAEIESAGHVFIACAENKQNVIKVRLKEGVIPNLPHAERNFYTTSSCGVCGKGSIDAIRTVNNFVKQKDDANTVTSEVLYVLPEILKNHQIAFADTGGIHAAGFV